MRRAIYIDSDAIVLWCVLRGGLIQDGSPAITPRPRLPRSDLERLWDVFATWGDQSPSASSAPIFGCAAEGPHPAFPTDYANDRSTLPVSPQFPTGLNSGVLLVSLTALRGPGILRAYWDAVGRVVREGGYAAPRLGNHSHGLREWRGRGEGQSLAVDVPAKQAHYPDTPCCRRVL